MGRPTFSQALEALGKAAREWAMVGKDRTEQTRSMARLLRKAEKGIQDLRQAWDVNDATWRTWGADQTDGDDLTRANEASVNLSRTESATAVTLAAASQALGNLWRHRYGVLEDYLKLSAEALAKAWQCLAQS